MKRYTFFTLAVLALTAFVWVGCGSNQEPLSTGDQQSVGPASKPAIRNITAAIAVQNRHTPRLMFNPDVVGTATGLGPDGSPVIKVFTTRPGVSGIPASLDGVPVSVETTGKFVARTDPTARQPRPVPIGVSTGHPNITAGTIGARVRDTLGNVYALSNNHVYANGNDASIGDSALQPGPYDGGSDPADKIGELADFEKIQFPKGNKIPENTMDAAIARSSTTDLGHATPADDGYGAPGTTPVAATLGQTVQKYGRTTGLTYGTVTEINVIVDVCYQDNGMVCLKAARFVDQIGISGAPNPGDFSAGGDSGSLIVTNDGNNSPVGLLFAGSATRTIANRIDLVLDRFNVTIDGEAPPSPATGSIGGAVTSAADGSPVAGASISVDTGQSATTAGDGTYTLSGVPTGDRSVTASADGFQPRTQPATVNENETTPVDFALDEAPPTPALNVTVTTDKSSYGHRETVIITVHITDGTNDVSGAAVHVEIVTPDGKFLLAGDGTTDAAGETTFTHKVNSKRDGTGTNTVNATASKTGFISGSGSTTFETQ